MKISRYVAALAALIVLTALNLKVASAQTCPDGPTPELFGYRSQPLAGSIPVLVVIVDFDDSRVTTARSGTEPRDEAYWDELVFGIRPTGVTRPTKVNLNGLYQASSGGLVSISKAGIVRVHYPGNLADIPPISEYDAAVTRLTAAAFPIQRYDRNSDRRIDSKELAIVRILNTPRADMGGQTRGHRTTFTADGTSYTWDGDTFNVDQEGGVSLFAHELFHLFGFPEHIYGPGFSLNNRASFFAASAVPPVILDPFHRMKAGWTMPRLVDMSMPGSMETSIYSGSTAERSPILLYDRAHCANEYFMLEFRNPRHGSSPYDSGAIGPGVLVWYVKQKPDHSLFAFDWPPPITGAGRTMLGEFLAGPGAPGSQTFLTRTSPEYSPMWFTAPSATANVGIEVNYSDTGAVAGVQWRPRDRPFIARIHTVQGARPAPVMRATGNYIFTLDGVFPVRSDGLTARLVNLTGRQYRLTIESLTPTRMTLRKPDAVEPGTYQLMIERDAPRQVRSVYNAGGAGVTFR